MLASEHGGLVVKFPKHQVVHIMGASVLGG